MINYQCPHCGNSLQIPEKYAGQAGKCNSCGNAITVPRAPSAPQSKQRAAQTNLLDEIHQQGTSAEHHVGESDPRAGSISPPRRPTNPEFQQSAEGNFAPSDKKRHISLLQGCLIASGGMALIGLLFVGGCAFLFGSAVKEVEDERQAEVERIQAEPISDVTWEEVGNIYELGSDFTNLQKTEHWKHYEGKKVQWSGTVSSISETFGTLTLQVKLNPQTFTSDVLVRLKESERSKAVNISEGSAITFVGVLDDWGTLLPITLDYGEIIR